MITSRIRPLLMAASASALAACATQSAYRTPVPSDHAWATDFKADAVPLSTPRWWTLLNDPSVDVLVERAFENNPTLDRALATLEEAQANAGLAKSAGLPTLGVDADLTRSGGSFLTQSASSDNAFTSSSASLGFNWELDLFGRIRSSREAALRRLDARDIDSQGARLALAAETASAVVDLRSCRYSSVVQQEQRVSLEEVLALTRLRASAGNVAPADVDRAIGSVEDARADLASTDQLCAEIAHDLAVLTGQPIDTLYELTSPKPDEAELPTQNFTLIHTRMVLPANVLARNPAVMSAERELAAAWADIGEARAERLPRLNLAAILTGQWLRVAGTASDTTTGSLGIGLSAPLLDGGRGKANVDATKARYHRAAANLEIALRQAWRDVENSLSALKSAQLRHHSARESLRALSRLLTASEAQWHAGAISLFELEDARRRYAQARDNAITAACDGSQAWIGLVQASGNAAITSESNPNEFPALSYN